MAIIENLADMVGVTPQVFLITIAVLVVRDYLYQDQPR